MRPSGASPRPRRASRVGGRARSSFPLPARARGPRARAAGSPLCGLADQHFRPRVLGAHRTFRQLRSRESWALRARRDRGEVERAVRAGARRDARGATRRTLPSRRWGGVRPGRKVEAPYAVFPSTAAGSNALRPPHSSWGGACAKAQGSGREGRWRCSSISRTTFTSVMKATTWRWPPQGHVRTSMAKERLSYCTSRSGVVFAHRTF